MPTYEYRCPKGHEFELFQRMSDPPEAECPECGEAAQRQLSAGAGLLFKGSGFYITDYRSDSYRKAAEREKSGGGKGDAKSGDGGGSKGGAKSGDGAGSKGGSGSGDGSTGSGSSGGSGAGS
ncbi:MAG TPA: zinc ribbon domain-containing protein [Longimicrobiales bacterium]|nr:zinc ribbon domain-containing protein [Longimicrobiales bacterium]